jgi:hypothetical protein
MAKRMVLATKRKGGSRVAGPRRRDEADFRPPDEIAVDDLAAGDLAQSLAVARARGIDPVQDPEDRREKALLVGGRRRAEIARGQDHALPSPEDDRFPMLRARFDAPDAAGVHDEAPRRGAGAHDDARATAGAGEVVDVAPGMGHDGVQPGVAVGRLGNRADELDPEIGQQPDGFRDMLHEEPAQREIVPRLQGAGEFPHVLEMGVRRVQDPERPLVRRGGGRDRADRQAGRAAEPRAFLQERDAAAQPRGRKGRHQTGAASADHDDVEIGVHSWRPTFLSARKRSRSRRKRKGGAQPRRSMPCPWSFRPC